MDRHGSKQGGQECPVQGAHEDIGQIFVVNTTVRGIDPDFGETTRDIAARIWQH